MKHGVHDGRCYWMGEPVEIDDFNERLMSSTRAAAKDLDWMAMGMQLTEHINEGQKVVAQIDVLEEVLKLPLCSTCRQLIGAKE
jgi:hypothetical protein